MRRRCVLALSGVAALAVGGGTVAALGLGEGTSAKPDSGSRPPATDKVTRMTLTETADLDGVLGYGTATPIEALGGGRITWLPSPGAEVRRGEPVIRVDDEPVVLLYGRCRCTGPSGRASPAATSSSSSGTSPRSATAASRPTGA